MLLMISTVTWCSEGSNSIYSCPVFLFFIKMAVYHKFLSKMTSFLIPGHIWMNRAKML